MDADLYFCCPNLKPKVSILFTKIEGDLKDTSETVFFLFLDQKFILSSDRLIKKTLSY
jgi:hypothetical protein